ATLRVPPRVRHRSPPSRPRVGTGRPARRASVTTARASASDRTITPSGGSGAPGSPHGSPFRMTIAVLPGSAGPAHALLPAAAGTAVATVHVEGRRCRHHAPLQGVGGLTG